jgi:hypothetical protein
MRRVKLKQMNRATAGVQDPVRGDHVYVRRGFRYTHHGIACGDGTVIHYVGPRGTVRHVGRTSIEDFEAGGTVRVKLQRRQLSADEAIEAAESMIGFADYHLTRSNCEHFAAWCSTGRARSMQVERWALAAHGMASFVVLYVASLHIAFAGLAGAGLYALTRARTRPISRADAAVAGT